MAGKQGLKLVLLMLYILSIVAITLACLQLTHTPKARAVSNAYPTLDSRVAALNLHLPWQSNGYGIGGYSYGCGDHDSTWDQYAIDFGLPSGTPVVAVFSGTAHIGTPDANGYGNNVWISHVDGSGNIWRAVYAHLSAIQVTEGQSVNQGNVIGLSGSSGHSTAAHLHFSLRLGGTGSYDGTGVVPEPMGGYTGFGHYGNTLDLLQGSQQQWPNLTSCGFNPSPSYSPATPGGWWIGPTPSDFSTIPVGTTLKINFRAKDYNNGGLSRIDVTTWTQGSNWTVLPASSVKISPVPGTTDEEDAYVELAAASQVSEVSVNVYSNDGNYQQAPNGVRHFCPTSPCQSSMFPSGGSGGTGGGGPLSDGVQICQNANYGAPCETFNYASDSTCILLDQMAGNQDSLQFVGSYVASYDAVMYHDTGCSTYLARYGSNVADLSQNLLANQFSSMRIEKHKNTNCSVAPNANGVLIYRDPGFQIGGGCMLVTSDVSDLTPSTFTGFSGLQFLGTYQYHYQVSVYTNANFVNLCGQYTLDQSDLRSCAGKAVSLQITPYTFPPQAQNLAPGAILDHSGAGAAVDGDLNTEWVGGNKVPLGFVFANPVTIQSVVVFDRKQNNPDNNQINTTELVFSDGTIITGIDMTSGGPRCAEVDFSAKQVSWVNVVPTDASGNNGYSEVQIWDTTGAVYSQNNCVMKYSMAPVPGSGPAPLVPVPSPVPTPTPTNTSSPTPTPTNTPSPTATPPTGVQLLPSGTTWHLVGNNGAAEQDEGIPANTLNGMATLQVTFDLHGTTFVTSDDGASIVFVQGGQWYCMNVVVNGAKNGYSGSQTLTVPLTAFHLFNSPGTLLQTNQSVSNLHTRFWNSGAFTVDITSVLLLPSGATPTPTPTVTSTPSPTVTPSPTATATPSPTPTPPTPFTVYDESLAANWGDWSWCATNNFNDTSHPHTGSHDLSWTVTCAWGGLSLRLPGGFDTTKYKNFTFALRASQAGQKVQVSFYDSNGNTGIPVQLSSTPAAGKYTVYSIPISAFKSTGTITGILIQDMSGNSSEPPMYVDTMKFA